MSLQTITSTPLVGTVLKGTELMHCYEGGTVDGQRHGHGTFQYPNRFFMYEGDWVAGKKQGTGTLKMGDGGYYLGSFEDDEIEGEGYRQWANGNTYSGHFHRGEMSGEGVWMGGNGDKYEGSFADNVRCGEGTLTWAGGDQYVGTFARHRPNGHGVLTTAAGDCYEGGWVDGKQQGHGSFAGASGDTYEGAWAAGEREGEGEGYYAATGIRYSGPYAAGGPVDVPTKLVAAWAAEEGDKDAGVKINVPAGGEITAITALLCVEREKAPDPEAPEDGAEEASKPPGKGGKAPPPPEEPAGPVMEDVTAAWESGRAVAATLHRGDAAVDAETGEVALGEPVPVGPQPPSPPAEGDEGYVPPAEPTGEGEGEGEAAEPEAPPPPCMAVTVLAEGGTATLEALHVPPETEPGVYTLVLTPAEAFGSAVAAARITVAVAPPPKQ